MIMSVQITIVIKHHGASASGNRSSAHRFVPSVAFESKIDVEYWGTPYKQECASPWEGKGSGGWRGGKNGGRFGEGRSCGGVRDVG